MQQRLSGGRGLLLFKRKLLSVMSSIVVTENAKKIRPRGKRRFGGACMDYHKIKRGPVAGTGGR